MAGAEESYNASKFYRPQQDDTTALITQGQQAQNDIIARTGSEEAAAIGERGRILANALPGAVDAYQSGQKHQADMAAAAQQRQIGAQNLQRGALELGSAQRKADYDTGSEEDGGPTREEQAWQDATTARRLGLTKDSLDVQKGQQDLARGAALMPGEVAAQTASTDASRASTAASRAQISNMNYQTQLTNAITAYQGAKTPEAVAELDRQFAQQGLKPQDIATAKTKAGIEAGGRAAASNLVAQAAPQAQYDQKTLGDVSAQISALADLKRASAEFGQETSFSPGEDAAGQKVTAALNVLDPAAARRFQGGWSPLNPGTTKHDMVWEALIQQRAAVEADLARVEQSARQTGNTQQLNQIAALRDQLAQMGTGQGTGAGHNSMSLTGGQKNANGMFLTGGQATPPPPPAAPAPVSTQQQPPSMRRGP